MNTNLLKAIFATIVAILGSLFLITEAISTNNPMSLVIRSMGMLLGVVCLLNPKAGLWIVTIEAFYVDYVKKVAVYYGEVSMSTITDVMVIVMIALVATCLGRLLQLLLKTGKPASRPEIMLYLLGAFIAAAVFFSKRDFGFASAVQQAFNTGVYIAIAGLIVGLFESRKELLYFLGGQTFFAVTWAIMGIKQTVWGFSPMEYFYAETGLSPVSSNQFLSESYGERPRASGFGSGASNYALIVYYCMFSLWAAVRLKSKRLIYLCGFAILFTAALLSKGKTLVALCLLGPVWYTFLRTRRGTQFAYTGGITVVLLVILFSDQILLILPEFSGWFLAVTGLPDIYSLQTFSPRLTGYMQLKDPANWSLLPNPELGGHDSITGTLARFGVIGLVAFFAFGFIGIKLLHAAMRSVRDAQDRDLAVCLGSFAVLFAIVGSMIGGVFESQPNGLAIWTFVGGVFLLAQLSQKQISTEVTSTESPKPLNQPLTPVG